MAHWILSISPHTLFCLGNIAGSILRQRVFGLCCVASSGSISPCQARSLLLSSYKRCRCFPSGSPPCMSRQPQRGLDQHLYLEVRDSEIELLPLPLWKRLQRHPPPSPTPAATTTLEGGQAIGTAPATSSAVFTHPQVPLHSGGRFQGLLNSRTAGSCALRGEAGPCAQDSWQPHPCLREERVTKA